MKIGVLSDTHDQQELIVQCVNMLNDAHVDLVIHCGDWISPFILHAFKGLKMPMQGVFGNNDGDKFRHLKFSQQYGLNITFEDRFLELSIDHRKIAVFHGDYQGIVDALVTCGAYDAVFHGHTHQKINETVGKTLSLNPGSLMKATLGEPLGASFAIYDTKTNQAEHYSVE
jgi:putative phosphoesterase